MLKKLSLAALVALGSVSALSAQPLTEAIKNVNVGGYTKLRAYYDTDNGSYKTKYRTTALLKFSVPVSEELKFNTAYAFDWSLDGNGVTRNEATTPAKTGVPVAPAYGNVKFFLQYSKDNLTALVGKIPVPTPVTATGVGEATAAGAIALYKVNDQVTAAAAFLDDLVGTDKVTPKGNNTYALAGIFGTNIGTVQAWLFKVENTINYDAVVMANVKAVENVDLNVRMAIAKLDKAISDKTQTYFDVDAKYTAGKVCASAGFAKTGKDGGTVVLDADAPLVKVLPTEQYDNIANSADDYALYAKAGYSVDAKTNAYVAVAKADKAFNYEVVAGCNHAYTDKFKIHAYVSQADTAGKDNDNLEVSASFTYSF